jgi:two-component system, NtrC family, sensor kinase
MKSKSAKRVVTKNAPIEAFKAFFETLETPAALCGDDWEVLAANPAFALLCGVYETVGQKLTELLPGLAQEPLTEGSTRNVEVALHDGQMVTLALSRRGDTITAMARNLSAAVAGGSLAAAGRALLEQARVEKQLLQLGREVAGSTSEEELVAVVARGVKGLFPGRSFCIRIADSRSFQLTSLYAEGRLRPGARDVMVVKRSAAEKTNLSTERLPVDRVRITDDEVPLIFVGSVRSICAPLVASGQLFGVINVEYPEGLAADLLADDRILIQLANQVSVGIRNAKLIEELTFVRKYLEELLEHANALILVANRDRRVMVYNRLLTRLTGFEKKDVLGEDLLKFIPESERMRVMRVIVASLKGEQVSNFETRVLTRDGQEIRVSFATSSVLTAHGEVEGVIAIGQDLTAVKELEKRIIQAEKLASLGQLAASVVHEINNPMTAVATYADALLSRIRTQPNTGPDQEKLRKILENSDRILRFTRDLVSYARPAQDKPTRVDLAQALEMAVSFCDHVLSKHDVQVQKSFEPLPTIAGVKANLIQVFVNLITNACHAMRSGGVVKLSLTREDGCVVARVADTGMGIEPRNLEKIFEPFYTTKVDGRGTGLGLSIVQGIVEKHGGTVDVASQLEKGTTFTIRLPLAESQDS